MGLRKLLSMSSIEEDGVDIEAQARWLEDVCMKGNCMGRGVEA